MSFKEWSASQSTPANDKSGDKAKAAPVVAKPDAAKTPPASKT